MGTWLAAVLDALVRLGIDRAVLLAPREPFGPPRRRVAPLELVDVAQVRLLWWRAVELSGDPQLGLKVGRILSLQALNVLGLALQHSPDIRAALSVLLRHQALVSNSGRFLPAPVAGGLLLTYRPTASPAALHPAQLDSVCAGLVRFLRLGCCDSFAPGQVCLPEAPGTGDAGYASWFGCPVTFGAPEAQILIDDGWLDRPVVGADPELLVLATNHAAALRARQGRLDALSQTVRALIGAQGFAGVTCAATAETLGVSERTLQRRLAEAGTSFRSLLEAARLNEAVQRLTTGEATLAGIAHQLGYSEPGSLSRAVRKGYGATPSMLRAAARGPLQARASAPTPPRAAGA